MPLAPPWCERCGQPLVRALRSCSDCPPEPVARLRAPFLYEGPARAAVHRLKFSGWRSVAGALAAAMAAMDLGEADAIAWVPLARSRLAARGFDQAAALARALGPRLQLPVVSLLQRTVETTPQARRSGDERRAALLGAFRCTTSRPPGSILLVDDVLTTGATAAACAVSLVQAGATEVSVVTAARALSRSGGRRYTRGVFPSGSVVARGSSPVVDASRGRNDPRKATVGR